ncbi:MAG: AzlC family ABC transporter permease [Clostridia bacterium]|nr:AzlC family ABC transporter permease [Clostridia bacterium]
MEKSKTTSDEKQQNFSRLSFEKGIKDGLPIGLGYLSVAFAFGVQASIAGVPILMSVFISMTNLTSAGQLAGLNIIAACGTILEMILTQLVINARYFLMSITLTQKLDGSFTFGHRLLCSAFVTDEIFAIAAAKPKTFGRKYFYGLVILPYVGWTLGTLLGASAGSILPDFIINALGIALYAMFVAIILPPSITTRGVLPAVALGAGISCAIYFIPAFSNVSTGIAIIISAVISALVIAAIFPIKDKEQER